MAHLADLPFAGAPNKHRARVPFFPPANRLKNPSFFAGAWPIIVFFVIFRAGQKVGGPAQGAGQHPVLVPDRGRLNAVIRLHVHQVHLAEQNSLGDERSGCWGFEPEGSFKLGCP